MPRGVVKHHRGTRNEKPIHVAGRERSRINFLYYFFSLSPNITNLRKQQIKVIRVVYKSDDEEKHSWENDIDECCRNERPKKDVGHHKLL